MVSYPISLEVKHPETSSRGLALLGLLFWFPKAIALLPLLMFQGAAQAAFQVGSWLNFWLITFRGTSSIGIQKFQHAFLQLAARNMAWMVGLTDVYPSLTLDANDTSSPVYVRIAALPQQSSRGLGFLGIITFLKMILLIPHIIVLYILGLAVGVATWVNFLVVVFTGKGIRGVLTFQHGVLQWGMRMVGYLVALTDEYPPFSLEVH